MAISTTSLVNSKPMSLLQPNSSYEVSGLVFLDTKNVDLVDQMIYCILAIGPYTNRNTKQNYAHTQTNKTYKQQYTQTNKTDTNKQTNKNIKQKKADQNSDTGIMRQYGGG